MKLAFVLVVLVGRMFGADELVASFAGNGYVREAWIVSREAFTTKGLQERARAFLGRHAPATFGRLEISVGPGVRFYSHKGVDHETVESYFYGLQHVFRDGVQAYGDIASLIKVGPSAVLRIRQGGKVSTINVGEEGAPMPGAAAGFEILHFGPLFNRGSVEGVEVFVRSRNQVTEEALKKLAKELRHLRPQLRIQVIARMDPWFITHPGFPFLYPFDDPVLVPSPEAYRRSPPGGIAVDPEYRALQPK